jgi:hypothetical protein
VSRASDDLVEFLDDLSVQVARADRQLSHFVLKFPLGLVAPPPRTTREHAGRYASRLRGGWRTALPPCHRAQRLPPRPARCSDGAVRTPRLPRCHPRRPPARRPRASLGAVPTAGARRCGGLALSTRTGAPIFRRPPGWTPHERAPSHFPGGRARRREHCPPDGPAACCLRRRRQHGPVHFPRGTSYGVPSGQRASRSGDFREVSSSLAGARV